MTNREQALRDLQHFGEEGGVAPVIDVSATSTFLDPTDMEKVFRGEVAGCYLYSRHSNPTVDAFGKKLAALEGMEAALGVASGMAAIATSLEALLEHGDHLISSSLVYGGTYAFFKNLLARRGISVSFVHPQDLDGIRRAITPRTRAIYTETMSNPLLAVSDIAALKEIAAPRKIKVVVDNTFTPLLVRPGELGADVVLYSCTKYISGASDLIAGAIVSSRDFVASLSDVNSGPVMLNGPVMDARIAHELYMRLDHLGIRMAAHSRAAAHLSHALASEGIPVVYPGLTSHPDYSLLKKMISPHYGFGGMMAIDCGSQFAALTLAKKLQEQKFGLFAVSLGFSRTLMSCPASSTSSEIPADEQSKMGLGAGVLRLSIGFSGDDAVMTDRFMRCYREVFPKTQITAGVEREAPLARTHGR